MFMLLREFVIFFTVTGLSVNYSKSEIYMSNVDIEDMRRIIDVSGFKVGKLFFRYLGGFIYF